MNAQNTPNRAAEAHEGQKARERIMEKARKKYTQKDFLDRQRNLYEVTGAILIFLHILSVIFAIPLCAFLFYQVVFGKELANDAIDLLINGSAQTGMMVVVVLSIAALFALEWVKSSALQTFFEIRYAENHTPKGLLIVCALLVCASILTSVKGGGVLGKVRTEAPELVDETGITSRYQAQIDAERDHQRTIREGRHMKWKGALTPQGTKELAASGSRIDKLHTQMEAELINARMGNAGAQMSTAGKAFANSRWFMGLALVVDLGILLAIFYRERFEYLSVALTGSGAPRQVGGISVGPGGVTLYGAPHQAPTDTPNRNAIGFRAPDTPVNPGPTGGDNLGQSTAPMPQGRQDFEAAMKAAGVSADEVAYLRRYKPAVEVFLQGGSVQDAYRAAGCSRSTAKSVKLIMRSVGMLPEHEETTRSFSS